MTRGRVSRSYVNGYRDSWAGVVQLDLDEDPGRYDEDYSDGRRQGWLTRQRAAYEKYGTCDPDTCICNYCQGGPDGPW